MKLQYGQLFLLVAFAAILQTTLAGHQLEPVSKREFSRGQPAFKAGRQPVLMADALPHLSFVELNSTIDDLPDADKETKIELTPDQVDTLKKLAPLGASEFQKLSISVEILIASAWILLIASSPLILTYSNWHKITKVHAFEFVVLIIWLAGGLYLFTNVILFVSYHFEGERSLTIVQAVYMLSQIVTTVGYGDIGPANSRGQIFVALYIIAALLVVGNIIGEVTVIVQDKIQESRIVSGVTKIVEEELKAEFKEGDDESNHTESAAAARALEEGEPTAHDWNAVTGIGQLNYAGLASSIVTYAIMAVIGATFYHYYPGEEKTIWQAIYMSIVTLSTTGFGNFVANTPAGQAFGAFWMLFGVGALGAFVSQCMEFSVRMKQAQQARMLSSHKEVEERLESMKTDQEGRIEEHDFMKFALVQAGHCSEDQIESILDLFRRLQPDKDQKIPFAKLEQLVINEEDEESIAKPSIQV